MWMTMRGKLGILDDSWDVTLEGACRIKNIEEILICNIDIEYYIVCIICMYNHWVDSNYVANGANHSIFMVCFTFSSDTMWK